MAEFLDGRLIVDERDYPLPALRCRLLPHEGEIAVVDTGSVHGVAPGPEEEVARSWSCELGAHGDEGFQILFRDEWTATGSAPNKGDENRLIRSNSLFYGGGLRENLHTAIVPSGQMSLLDETGVDQGARPGRCSAHLFGEITDRRYPAEMNKDVPNIPQSPLLLVC